MVRDDRFLIPLTIRDEQMLEMCATYAGVTADQIGRRFYQSGGQRRGRSACYARIARLVVAGYLRSRRLPARTGVGSGKAFLTPGPAAFPLLVERLGVSRAELRRSSEPVSLLFVAHHLAVGDFRLSLELAAPESA